MNKRTVWAVGYEGDCEEFVVDKLFSTRENAVLYAESFNFNPTDEHIKEYLLDEHIESLSAGLRPFTIQILQDGKVEQVFRLNNHNTIDNYCFEYDDPDEFSSPPPGTIVSWYLNLSLLARDQSHAVEIADKRRREFLAAGEWPEPYVVTYTGRPYPPRCFSFGSVKTFNLPGQHPGWHMDDDMRLTYVGEPVQAGTPNAEVELIPYGEWKKASNK